MPCLDLLDDGIVVRMAFVYILRCADGTLYVGQTQDLASRERSHNQGQGAHYTASRLPVHLVYAEEYGSGKRAIGRERQLKRWTAEKKEALIIGDRLSLKALSKRRGQGST